jgi:hypothetical protein
MDLPRPRAYIDWRVPVDAFGNDIGICSDDASYRHYLIWLAEYLYVTELPVPASQRELLAEYRVKGVEHAIFDLSEELGCSMWYTDAIEHMFSEGKVFAGLHASEIEVWNELPEEDKEEWDKEEFFTSESDYERIGQEFREAQKVPARIRHADIPYRPILAALFKDIADAKKRYELLDRYYRNFNETASK